MMKKSIAATVAILLLCAVAWALDDTPANRGQQADRYLAAMPVKEMLANMVAQVSKNIPAKQRQAFRDMLTKHLDMPALEKVMRESLAKRLTADELKAMADFYGSAVGKSAMKKLNACMGDFVPAVQLEMMKAQDKARQQASEDEPKPSEPAPGEPKAKK
jgi:hypothetical protein